MNFLIFIMIIFPICTKTSFSPSFLPWFPLISQEALYWFLSVSQDKDAMGHFQVISHPVHAEQPTVCGITLTQTNWKISPLSEQNA